MKDLSGGMDSGIGPAGAVDRGLALAESVERFFQKILHGVSSGLALPSIESRAVVGDFEKKPHALASSQP